MCSSDLAGFHAARAEIIITLDGDLQNDPRDMPALLAKMAEGYEVVSGWRKDRKDTFINRTLPSRIANRLISRSTGVTLHDYGCALKAYQRNVLRRFELYGQLHRFLPALCAMAGARVGETPVVGLPGFPTSCLFTGYLFAEPMVRRLAGLALSHRRRAQGVLTETVSSPAGKRQFLPVQLSAGKASPVYRASSTITSMMMPAAGTGAVPIDASKAVNTMVSCAARFSSIPSARAMNTVATAW